MAHEKSVTFERDGAHVLLRTVIDGNEVTPEEAWQLFERGENPAMGIFRNEYELKQAQQLYSDTDNVPYPERKPGQSGGPPPAPPVAGSNLWPSDQVRAGNPDDTLAALMRLRGQVPEMEGLGAHQVPGREGIAYREALDDVLDNYGMDRPPEEALAIQRDRVIPEDYLDVAELLAGRGEVHSIATQLEEINRLKGYKPGLVLKDSYYDPSILDDLLANRFPRAYGGPDKPEPEPKPMTAQEVLSALLDAVYDDMEKSVVTGEAPVALVRGVMLGVNDLLEISGYNAAMRELHGALSAVIGEDAAHIALGSAPFPEAGETGTAAFLEGTARFMTKAAPAVALTGPLGAPSLVNWAFGGMVAGYTRDPDEPIMADTLHGLGPVEDRLTPILERFLEPTTSHNVAEQIENLRKLYAEALRTRKGDKWFDKRLKAMTEEGILGLALDPAFDFLLKMFKVARSGMDMARDPRAREFVRDLWNDESGAVSLTRPLEPDPEAVGPFPPPASPVLVSQVRRVIEGAKFDKAPLAAWRKLPGFKPEEWDALDLDTLEMYGDLTKKDLLEWIDVHQLDLVEHRRGFAEPQVGVPRGREVEFIDEQEGDLDHLYDDFRQNIDEEELRTEIREDLVEALDMDDLRDRVRQEFADEFDREEIAKELAKDRDVSWQRITDDEINAEINKQMGLGEEGGPAPEGDPGALPLTGGRGEGPEVTPIHETDEYDDRLHELIDEEVETDLDRQTEEEVDRRVENEIQYYREEGYAPRTLRYTIYDDNGDIFDEVTVDGSQEDGYRIEGELVGTIHDEFYGDDGEIMQFLTEHYEASEGSGRAPIVRTQHESRVQSGSQNYREITIQLPEEPGKETFKHAHWPEDNILVWVRFNERLDEQGRRILFIEEIQSDWHQAARHARIEQVRRLKKAKGISLAEADKIVDPLFGYRTQHLIDQATRAAGLVQETRQQVRDFRTRISGIERVVIVDDVRTELSFDLLQTMRNNTPAGAPAEGDFGDLTDISPSGRPPKTRRMELAIILKHWAKLNDLNARAQQTRDVLMTASRRSVPDAPFKKTWPQLAIKRIARLAADEGFDGVAWTNGQIQALRAGHISKIDKIHIERVGGRVKYTARSGRGDHLRFEVDAEGRIQDSGNDMYEDRKASFVFGEELANAMIHADPPDGDFVEISVGPNSWNVAVRPTGNRDTWEVINTETNEVLHVVEGAADEAQARELALAQNPDLSGSIEIGGYGMKGFYDDMLPSGSKKSLKGTGAQHGKVRVRVPIAGQEGPYHDMPGFMLDEGARDKIKKGLPLYSAGAAPLFAMGDEGPWSDEQETEFQVARQQQAMGAAKQILKNIAKKKATAEEEILRNQLPLPGIDGPADPGPGPGQPSPPPAPAVEYPIQERLDTRTAGERALDVDQEGRSLIARFVAGVRNAGDPDYGLTPQEIIEIVDALADVMFVFSGSFADARGMSPHTEGYIQPGVAGYLDPQHAQPIIALSMGAVPQPPVSLDALIAARHAERIDNPLTGNPDVVAFSRDAWVAQWLDYRQNMLPALGIQVDDWPNVMIHEVGHLIDMRAGSFKEAIDRLGPLVGGDEGQKIKAVATEDSRANLLYEAPFDRETIDEMVELSRLNRPDLWDFEGTRRDYGDGVAEAQENYAYTMRELMADTIAVYLKDPALTKRIAPRAAKHVRDLVNENPSVNPIVQFNSLVPLVIPAAGAGALGEEDDDG